MSDLGFHQYQGMIENIAKCGDYYLEDKFKSEISNRLSENSYFYLLHLNPFVHTVVPEQQNILIKNSHVLYVSMGNRGLLGKTMDGKERRLGMGEATMVLFREVA